MSKSGNVRVFRHGAYKKIVYTENSNLLSKVEVKVKLVEKRFHTKNRIYTTDFDVYPTFSSARNRINTTRKVSDHQDCQILATRLPDGQFPL